MGKHKKKNSLFERLVNSNPADGPLLKDGLPTCLDASDFEPYISESPATSAFFHRDVVEEDTPIRNRKARKLAAIAKAFAEYNELIVVGESIYQYISELGCFWPVQYPERLLERFLPTDQADQLNGRDFAEILGRIMRISSIQRDPDQFNCNTSFINCKNGVVSYTSYPLTMDSHSPNYGFSYVVDANFIPEWDNPACPVFNRFCETSLDGDKDKRQLLLEIIGYIASDSTDGKCAFFLKGAPDSGKSVMADFICKLFTDEMVSSVPLHKLSERFNKAELFGKKVNVCGEIKAKKLTDITTFKMVTGGDRIHAEYKGKDPFAFKPRCKLLFSGNALPGTMEADSTAAFANRLVVLLFNKSIPKENQDKDLLAKLLEERDAIFSLAIQALRELHRRNYIFTYPKDTLAFLRTFSYNENSVRAFIEDRCIPDLSARIFNCDLFDAYKEYCIANGLEARPRQQLYDAVDAIPGVLAARIRIGPENRRGRFGVKLLRTGGTMEHSPKSIAPQAIGGSAIEYAAGTLEEPDFLCVHYNTEE